MRTETLITPESGTYAFGLPLKTKVINLLTWDADKDQVTEKNGVIYFEKGKRMLPIRIVRELGLREVKEVKTFGVYYSYTL